MKKQILFLTFLIAAVFAGLTSYGQENAYLTSAPTYCAPALPLTCLTGAPLTPSPGTVYTYEISHTGAAGSTTHWLVTDESNVIAASALTATIDADGGGGSYILDAEDGVYNSGTNTATSIDISWKSFDGAANEVLLVAYVKDATGCITDNIQVWRIIPQYAFTLDIAGLTDAGDVGGAAVSECVSPVLSATYDGTSLTMDYGQNYVFFSVNAANWQTSWIPSFTTASSVTGSTVGTVEWAYPDEANGATSVWHPATDPVLASEYGASNFIGATGQCIVLRVLVDHGGNEIAAAAETVVVGVNGDMWNPTTSAHDGTYLDLDESATGCVTTVTDEATYTLNPRPDVQEVTPAAGTFEPKN